MEPNYLILLEYSTAQVVIIKLTEEEKSHIDNYEDFEDFMRAELEEKIQVSDQRRMLYGR